MTSLEELKIFAEDRDYKRGLWLEKQKALFEWIAILVKSTGPVAIWVSREENET